MCYPVVSWTYAKRQHTSFFPIFTWDIDTRVKIPFDPNINIIAQRNLFCKDFFLLLYFLLLLHYV